MSKKYESSKRAKKAYVARNPQRRRDQSHTYGLKRVGVDPKVYAEAVKRQGNLCASCGNPETYRHGGRIKRLAADHNHATKEFRGVLCQSCNMGIGYFKDSADLLEQAAAYLEHGRYTILLDFDGVLAEHYSHWGNQPPVKPLIPGLILAHVLQTLGYTVVIFTARPKSMHKNIAAYLATQGFEAEVSNVKIPCAMMIDDKAYRIPKNWK